MKKKNKVLLIGWDSADWKVINPLLDAGEMPALQSLIDDGVCGNISTLDPPLSPMLWSSIATGMRPHKHGVLGFLEPDHNGKKLRQVQVTARKVKAIWNILNQNNLKSNVIGWWPSHPAEPVNGTVISNFFQVSNNLSNSKDWNLPKGSVHPEEMESVFSELRIHPTELTYAHILPFIPKAGKINQEKDKSIHKLAKNLSEASSLHNCLTYLLETDKDWDFMAVYYEAMDMISHGFMKFHPPRRKHIPLHLYELYKDVVNNTYRFHDMMLKRILDMIDKDTTVILLSDHGFHSDHLRPIILPKEPAAIALEHSPYGIFIARGPNIIKDERVYGASVLDITPTILSMFNLPIGKDMDGKPLLQIFKSKVESRYIDSWEEVEGASGQHPKELKTDIYEVNDKDAMKQLAELGYIEEPSEDNDDQNFINSINENKYYLARSYFSAGEYAKSIEILESLYTIKPPKIRFVKYLLECLLHINNIKRCNEIYKDLVEYNKTAKKINKDKNEKKMIVLSQSYLDFIKGNIFLSRNKFDEAIKYLEKAFKNTSISKIALADAYFQAGRFVDAISVYTEELKNDPDNSQVLYQVGLCYMKLKEYESAIEYIIDSVSLIYFNASAHFSLGKCFYELKMYQEAAQAYETAHRLAPRMRKAYEKLKDIYEIHLPNPDRLKVLEESVIVLDKKEINIVSGLPRSGTSMMMQLLEAGGLEVFTDKIREPDVNNPKGYYEHENVKFIHKDNTWLKEAVGKTVKVVSHLLKYLPPRFHYKIVFMERDIDEVLLSQTRMLKELGKLPDSTAHFALEKSFKDNISGIKKWAAKNSNIDIAFINYADVIENPEKSIAELNAFFSNQLDIDSMKKVIDKSMYRSKLSLK